MTVGDLQGKLWMHPFSTQEKLQNIGDAQFSELMAMTLEILDFTWRVNF